MREPTARQGFLSSTVGDCEGLRGTGGEAVVHPTRFERETLPSEDIAQARCVSKDRGHGRACMVLRAMPPGRANARPRRAQALAQR